MLQSEQIRWTTPDKLWAVSENEGRPGATDPVTEAAITGAALVRHLDDFRFASLRALRQLHRALGAERVAVGLIAADGRSIREELAWAGGFGRCGESERVISCEAFAAEMSAWLATRSCSLEVEIDALAPLWHELSCDHLMLVRGGRVVEGRGQVALVVQMRNPARLADGADHAMALLLDEYGRRRQAVRA